MVFARSFTAQLRRPAASLLSGRVNRAAGPCWQAASPFAQARTLTATANRQVKVLMCLYDVSLPSAVMI